MERNYKEAERERDDLKKATQAKFAKLSNNHKAGEKLVCLLEFHCLSLFMCLDI